MIEFLDPRAQVGTVMEPYTLGHPFTATGSGTCVGLLANGFPDSANFLERIGKALLKQRPELTLKFWDKGNPTVSVSDKVLAQIKSQCQVVITAYGH